MTPREIQLQTLRDTLEHLSDHQRRLDWSPDTDTVRVLTDAMIRDLERCLTLCKSLRDRSQLKPYAKI